MTKGEAPWHILNVNRRWCNLTGFTPEEALGKTCRMLQGPATCANALAALEAALQQKKPLTLRLLNYDAQRVPFMNTLQVRAPPLARHLDAHRRVATPP